MKQDDRVPGQRDEGKEPIAPSEDVAGLYSWANLEGSKYRDFSASRKKSRAEALDRNDLERFRRESDAEAAALVEVEDARIAEEAERIAVEKHIESRKPDISPRPLLIADSPAFSLSRTARSTLEQAPGPRRVPTETKKRSQRSSTSGGSARWTALKNVFEQSDERKGPTSFPPVALDVPSLAFVSLAGGVGKTSLVASLGCSLADRGESVLLVDTNDHGLLPFYFGARQLTGETIRTFASSTTAAPIQVMTMDNAPDEPQAPSELRLVERISHHAYGMNRILIDVSTASKAILRQILRISPKVMVTLTPDMSSVVSLQPVQAFLQELNEESERPAELYYLLNQFDPSLRLHVDVRALLSKELGDRLSPVAIHRSGAFSEALAEGMTVVDYAPDSQAAEDLNLLGQWLREFDMPSEGELQNVRWSER